MTGRLLTLARRSSLVTLCALLLTTAGTTAAVTPEAGAKTLAAYCSPSGDICYGALTRSGQLFLQITTAAHYFSRYALCVTLLPRGDSAEHAQRCGAFPLFRRSGSTWGSSVNLARQYIGLPGARPSRGRYQTTWRQVCAKCPPKARRHSGLGQPLGRSLYFRWPPP